MEFESKMTIDLPIKLMKTGFLILWLVCWALGATGQEERLTIRPIKNGDEPKMIMNAIKTDFPNGIAKDLAFLPAKLYGREWNLQLTGDTLEKVIFYRIQISEKGINYTAVYNKDGKLLSSKETIKISKVPDAVIKTIHEEFVYWTMDEAHEIIKTKGKKATLFYKVKLSVDLEHKIVFLDPEGKILFRHITI